MSLATRVWATGRLGVLAIILIAVAVGVFLAGGGTASAATTYYVDPAGNDANACTAPAAAACKTIQAAVNKALVAGDTVSVAAGTYVEAVNMPTAGITLTGSAGAIVKPGMNNTGIYVNGVNNVTVKGFEVDGTGGALYGIYAFNSTNTTVKNNVVHDIANTIGAPGNDSAGVGILYFGWGQGEDGATITGNTVSKTGRMGIWFGGMQSSSPYNFLLSSNGTISNNKVDHAWQGPTNDGGGAVQYNCGKDSLIADNVIHDTGLSDYGIYVAGSASGNQIRGNDIYTNSRGIVIVSDVSFCDGTGWAAAAKAAPDVHLNNIHGNTVWGLRTYNTTSWPGVVLSNKVVNATCNWWGAASGPGPVGPGSGDKVSADVTFTPWLLSAAPGFAPDPCAVVGGTTELLVNRAGGVTASASGSPAASVPPYTAIAGGSALAIVLAAVAGWQVQRRLARRRIGVR